MLTSRALIAPAGGSAAWMQTIFGNGYAQTTIVGPPSYFVVSYVLMYHIQFSIDPNTNEITVKWVNPDGSKFLFPTFSWWCP